MRFFKDDCIPKYWFTVLFGLKVIVSIILTSIYTNYYTDRSTADIFKYFDDSKVMFDALKTNPIDFVKMMLSLDFDSTYFNTNYYYKMNHWFRPYSNNFISDTHVVIRFNAFVRFFSFGYFQVHNIFINFISLLGLTAIYKAFKPFLKQKEKAFFYFITLFPSLLFWGSGLLKEGIIFFALGFLLLHYFKIIKQFSFKSLLFILLGIFLICFTKLYLLIALSIPLLAYFLSELTKKVKLSYLISTIGIILFSFLLPIIHHELDIYQLIAAKQQTFSRYILEVETNSGFLLPELTNSWSVIKNIPNALNNTLLRPYPWECNSTFVWLSLLENFVVIILIVISLIFRKRTSINFNIVAFTLIFALSLFILIGLTTPVYGAIIRYKIPATLFLFIALLTIVDIEKLKARFKWLTKIL